MCNRIILLIMLWRYMYDTCESSEKETFESILGKGVNDSNPYILLFPTMFTTLAKTDRMI